MAREYRGTVLRDVEVISVPDGNTMTIEIAAPDGAGRVREKVRMAFTDCEQPTLSTKEAVHEGKLATKAGKMAMDFGHRYFGANRDGRVHRGVQVDLEFDSKDDIAKCMVSCRDNFGRLVCIAHTQHVDPNAPVPEAVQGNYVVAAIEAGLSPYFTKYGRSTLYHKEFHQAEMDAMAAERGIWNVKTNEGGFFRKYNQMLPWWTLRELVVEEYRNLPPQVRAGIYNVRLHYDSILAACMNGTRITVMVDLRPKVDHVTPAPKTNVEALYEGVKVLGDVPMEGATNGELMGIMKRINKGVVIYAGTRHNKFNLWVPNVESSDGAGILKMIALRYAAQGRGYCYVTGFGTMHTPKQRPQITIYSHRQISDIPEVPSDVPGARAERLGTPPPV